MNDFSHNTRNCVIRDTHGRTIEGKFIKRRPSGVIIMDDCRGIRHTAPPERVIREPGTATVTALPPGVAGPVVTLPPGVTE